MNGRGAAVKTEQVKLEAMENGTAPKGKKGGGQRRLLRTRTSTSKDKSGPPLSVYRGFGSCRHAYAVTPTGARWMIAVLLRNALATLPPTMTKKMAGDSTLASAAVSGSAPAWLMRWFNDKHHSPKEFFFTRIFGQTEWEGCGSKLDL